MNNEEQYVEDLSLLFSKKEYDLKMTQMPLQSSSLLSRNTSVFYT